MRLEDTPDVLILGHPLLFKEQAQVSLNELGTKEFVHNLKILRDTQISSNGIGLAAPQIGWPARVLSVGISEENRKRYPMAPNIDFSYWINPQIIDISKETCWTWEGCLSVPGMRGWVERPSEITICGYDEKGERKEVSFDGFPARVMQHEMDHLDGYLFPMRVDDKELIIPLDAIEHQDIWPDNWPSPGARSTPRGKVSFIR